MEPDFWHARWKTEDTGFHEGEPNAFLVAHFGALKLPPDGRVFVPLCGKTRDIHWLRAQGYQVAGAELSALAVEQLFHELGLEPEIRHHGEIHHYQAENIDIYVGDIFALTPDRLGEIDGVYDRAALVALPEATRKNYVKHLLALSRSAPKLLVTLEYEKELIPGPPFSVFGGEVKAHYDGTHAVREVESRHDAAGLKGQYPVTERAWILNAKN